MTGRLIFVIVVNLVLFIRSSNSARKFISNIFQNRHRQDTTNDTYVEVSWDWEFAKSVQNQSIPNGYVIISLTAQPISTSIPIKLAQKIIEKNGITKRLRLRGHRNHLVTTYFKYDNKNYEPKKGLPMCVPLPSDRGASCFTPNNERAVCTSINICRVIKDAVVSRKPEAIKFAQQSQCGYDTEPLVCCGTTGYPVSTLVFDDRFSGAIVPFRHALLPDKSVCGIERSDDKVYGGENTDLDEFPWLVLLRYKDDHGDDAGFRCGGSLINNRYVLTAAHCVVLKTNEGISLSGVRLGEWRISTTRDCLGSGVSQECSDAVIDMGIQETVPHADYTRKSRNNDIALIRLRRNVAYTDFIRPICIPAPNTPSPHVGTHMVVAGWGKTEKNSSSDIKQKVKVPLVSQTDCQLKMGQRGLISENQLCAGGVSGKDSCQGDSGGPLMSIVERNAHAQFQWFQEGVISWGVGCGIMGFPGVYTRVSKYSKWVVDNMLEF